MKRAFTITYHLATVATWLAIMTIGAIRIWQRTVAETAEYGKVRQMLAVEKAAAVLEKAGATNLQTVTNKYFVSQTFKKPVALSDFELSAIATREYRNRKHMEWFNGLTDEQREEMQARSLARRQAVIQILENFNVELEAEYGWEEPDGTAEADNKPKEKGKSNE